MKCTTYCLVVAPVKHLFLHGPHVLGCWRGMPAADVCAGLTGVAADFWASHPGQCADVIDRHAWSFAVALYVALYFAALARLAMAAAGVVRWPFSNKNKGR